MSSRTNSQAFNTQQASNSVIKRLTIEGYLNLKRKKQWVKRYGKIEKCIFTYKNNQGDKNYKAKIDLREANIKLGQRE